MAASVRRRRQPEKLRKSAKNKSVLLPGNNCFKCSLHYCCPMSPFCVTALTSDIVYCILLEPTLYNVKAACKSKLAVRPGTTECCMSKVFFNKSAHLYREEKKRQKEAEKAAKQAQRAQEKLDRRRETGSLCLSTSTRF